MSTDPAGRTRTLLAEDGMPSLADVNTEFLVESDEGSPTPFPYFNDPALDNLQSFDSSREQPIDPRGLLSPGAPRHLGTSPHSSSGSDSASSKRTKSSVSVSTRTTYTGGDVTMSDGLDVKQDFRMSDFVNDGDEEGEVEPFSVFEATATPSATDNPFHFSDQLMDGNFEFGSAESSPSSFAAGGDAVSPHSSAAQNTKILFSPEPTSAKIARGHNKAFSQYSLTQSMNGLNTQGSREVSPTSNMAMSQETSPSNLFSGASPGPMIDFQVLPQQNGSPAHATMWPNSFALQPEMAGAIHRMPAVQFPFQSYGSGPYNLTIQPTPLKSRVETQIPIKMVLSPLPAGVRRLHLPTHTISKPKLLVKPRPEPTPDTLELHTVLVCTSAMNDEKQRDAALQRARVTAQSRSKKDRNGADGEDLADDEKPQNGGEVHICNGCMIRERKRAARKKVKKPEDEQLWLQDESKRIIVFNTHEVKDWASSHPHQPPHPGGEFYIDAPMRIACYCRHHTEKLGFQVIFTITDFRGQFIAQAMSSSIMITDDHKTHAIPQTPGDVANRDGSLLSPSQTVEDMNSLSPPAPFRASQSSSDLQSLKRSASGTFASANTSATASKVTSAVPTPRNLSRPSSPTASSGPSTKKRKASGSAKVPKSLTMTKLETSTAQTPGAQPSAAQAGGPSSASTSPFSPNLTSFPMASGTLFGQLGSVPVSQQPVGNGPPTPNSENQILFNVNRSASMDNLSMAQPLFSAPASSHPSRAPSPNSLRNPSTANPLHQMSPEQINQAIALAMNPLSATMSSAISAPVIHKIIPNEGPRSGGIEVTILGSGFFQGLEVMFGNVRATTTTFWGDTSLVCLLPPSPQACTVVVSFKHQNSQQSQGFSSKPQPVFKYVDDYEQQLMRTALTVLGHKMNGTIMDATEIARRIVNNGPNWDGSGSAGGQRMGGGFNTNFTANMDFEAQLLKVLELIDIDDSTHKARLNLRRNTGQTMLHLASAIGLQRFVAALLVRGVNLDLRDKGGYTALHMASLHNHPEIVRRLIFAGADPTLRTLSGLTAADVAQSRDVLRAIRRVERHARSRSGGSLHSRASSANSLKSLWEPMSTVQSEEVTTTDSSAEESPEYSDIPASEEDPDEADEPWLDMRRSISRDVRSPGETPSPLNPTGTGVAPGLASPSAAVTAFKEQFSAQLQQLQHAMTLQLQNLPQFPTLPQMPNFPGMPPLPQYQAMVMQRLASMVPNMGSPRLGSGEQGPGHKEVDGRWWDLSSFVSSSQPPPAYDEIFPETKEAFDKKQQSAACAAVEAEADVKCATLFDTRTEESEEGQIVQTTTAVSTASATYAQTREKLPALLQIGPKNAITWEQRANLRRAHAEKLKRLSRDRNLFFVWIPLLVVVLCAMLYSRFPGLFTAAWSYMPSFANAPVEPAGIERVVEVA